MQWEQGDTNFLFGHSALAKRRKGPSCLFYRFLERREGVVTVKVLWGKGQARGQL